MIFGYIRVFEENQNLDLQSDASTHYACEKVFFEKESGVKFRIHSTCKAEITNLIYLQTSQLVKPASVEKSIKASQLLRSRNSS